jgi:hypothetical protein
VGPMVRYENKIPKDPQHLAVDHGAVVADLI